MPEPRRRLAACLALLGLAGCATSDHMYLVRREVRCSAFGEPVEFLPESPERPHVEIALIEATGVIFVPTRWEALRLHLCREALSVEADAVVGLVQDQIGYSIGFTPLKIDWTNKKLSAIAIRYLEPGQQPDDVGVPVLEENGE